MAALTADRNTKRRDGDLFSFEAAKAIYAGALVAINADGKAVPATAAGTACAGVAQHQAAAGEPVLVRRGVFNFEDGADDAALTRADIGATAYVADDQTVKKAAGTPAASVAGIVVDVDAEGVWVRICGSR